MMQGKNIQRKRLLMRANRRGMKELDVILGGFAARHLIDLKALDRFEELLNIPDQDILNWVLERIPPPDDYRDLIIAIRADAQAHPLQK